MRAIALLALIAMPVFAEAPTKLFTNEELLGDRHVPLDCDEKTKVCKVSEADMRWIIARDRLLNHLLERTAVAMKNCGIKGI